MSLRAAQLCETVRKRIGADWPANGVLPSIRELAREFAVSPATVITSLRMLAERKIVEKTRQTGRYAVAERRTAPGEGEAFRPRVTDVRERLCRDVLQGQFSQVPTLPSIKELADRYGCGYRTISAALSSLAQQGLLEKKMRNFVPTTGGASTRQSRRHVWFIGPTHGLAGNAAQFTPLISAIEWELSMAGMGSLRTIHAEDPGSNALPKGSEVAGYLYLLDIRGSKWNWWLYLKDAAEKRGIPVVVIDCAEVSQSHPELTKSKNLCWISPDNLRAGRDIGLALKKMGHRRIAFISHAMFREPHEYKYRTGKRQFPFWARNRFLGLSEIYPVKPDGSGGMRWFDLFGTQVMESELSESIKQYENTISGLWGALRKNQHRTKYSLSQGLNPAYRLVNGCREAQLLRPAFEAALQDRSCTAWICVNDDVAAHALAFLEQRDVRVPEDISLAGFDNSLVSYDLGLASWEPNLSGIGHLSVNFLRYPAWVRADRSRRVWLPGRVFTRRSLGQARR